MVVVIAPGAAVVAAGAPGAPGGAQVKKKADYMPTLLPLVKLLY